MYNSEDAGTEKLQTVIFLAVHITSEATISSYPAQLLPQRSALIQLPTGWK